MRDDSIENDRPSARGRAATRPTIADELDRRFGRCSAGSIIIREMRPAILVLLFAIGSAVPAGAGQPPARPATPAAPDAARTGSTTEDPAYYFLLGRHLEGEGKLDEAIAAHKQAIALGPGIRGASRRARRALRPQRPRAGGARNRPGRARAGSGQSRGQQDPRHDLRRARPSSGSRSSRATTRPDYPDARHRRAREGPAATAPSTSTST